MKVSLQHPHVCGDSIPFTECGRPMVEHIPNVVVIGCDSTETVVSHCLDVFLPNIVARIDVVN
jgi:hypothetical protein